jgi:hypothetical protein
MVPLLVGAYNPGKLKLLPRKEMVKLLDGTGTMQTFHTVICRLNWGVMLHERAELSGEVQQDMHGGMDAMIAIRARAEKGEKWLASDDEYLAIAHALDLVDHMQDITTRIEQRDAMYAVLAANDRMHREAA